MDEQLQQVFAQAKEQLDNKKYRAALGDFTYVLEREKDWPEALFYRGWARFYNLDKLGAADDIARALELKPELAAVLVDTGIPVRELSKQLNSRACRSIGAGRPQDALREVAGALLIEQDYTMAKLTMGEAYVAMEEPIAAMDWLEKAVTTAAEYAGEIDTYDCYAPLRGYPRYQKLIGNEKTISVEAETLLTQAKEQFATKQYQEALAACEQALVLAPDWPEALLYCGLVKYRLAGNTGWVTELLYKSGGLDDLAKALDYDPSLEEALQDKGPLSSEMLAKALNDRGCDSIETKQYKEAFRDIKQALRLQPEYVIAYLTMAEYYMAWSKHEEALNWLEKAAALDTKIIAEIDTYECFRPLRVYERYRPFASEAPPVTDKSFYVLEMFVEPGAMREYIRFASGSLQHIEQVMIACIKGGLGFYKLVSYGQHIRLYRFEQGQKVLGLNLLPFILVTVPGQLTASFAETGKPNILDMEGNPLPASIEKTVIKKHKRTGASYEMKESISRDKYLSDLLWDYRACAEAKETLFVTPFAEVIGALEGIPLAGGEEAETAEGVFVADEVSEEESGNTCSMEEYLSVMRGKSNIEEVSEEKCLGGEV